MFLLDLKLSAVKLRKPLKVMVKITTQKNTLGTITVSKYSLVKSVKESNGKVTTRTSQQWQKLLGIIIRKITSNSPVIHHTSHFSFKRNLFYLLSPAVYPGSSFCNWGHRFPKSTAKGLVATRGFAAKWDHGLTNHRNDTGTGLLLVYSDLSSGLLPAYPFCKRGDLAAFLFLLTFILANLATDLLLPGAFALKSHLRFQLRAVCISFWIPALQSLHLVLLTNMKIAPSNTWT